MAELVPIEAERALDDHAEYAHLASAVAELRDEAAAAARALDGRTVWMINSAARGGGVAEMLPGMISHLRELGIATEWLVMSADDEFFELTKRIHNMLHGDDAGELSSADRELYERTNRDNARAVLDHVADGDIVVIHDPQPMPLAGTLKEHVDVRAVWRCHIGLDVANDATRAAWSFLEPYASAYDHAVFSAAEYVPRFLEGRSSIIYPALDPLTAKNRPLHVQEIVAILERAGLLSAAGDRPLEPFAAQVGRLQRDGRFGPASAPEALDLLRRPLITQVSRWDRLKGFAPLMRGFAQFRKRLQQSAGIDDATRSRLQRTRLVLAGPDPGSVDDDPEGRDVLDELTREYLSYPTELQADIAILAMPMADAAENALIVNALQRTSTVVAQNSIREGFGLTITEAMWKGVPVLTNSAACGPRQQVRDSVDGRIIADPRDSDLLADTMVAMLGSPLELAAWGRAAQRRVHDNFLIYAQLQHWLRLLEKVA